MNRRLTLHWYVPVLKLVSDCLRELAMDDLKICNSKLLVLNSYNAAPIPDDYMDYIRIGTRNGQYVKPMTQNDGYNRMYNYDQGGNPIPFPTTQSGDLELAVFGIPFLSYYVNSYNARGENVGGLYGYRTDGSPFTFDIIQERNEIQFDANLGFEHAVMDYISDGRSSTAATKIITYAEATIEEYVYDALDRHSRPGAPQQMSPRYVGARTVLRGRLNDLTTDDYINIYRNTYNASPK